MPDKNVGKTAQPTQAKPSSEDLRAAYQIHTLAQMMYGQLYGPWSSQAPAGVFPVAMGPHSVPTQSWPVMGMHTGLPQPPQAMSWYGASPWYPFGWGR